MKPKPVVGQKLYMLNVGNSARHCSQQLVPATVVKAGRKYFTVAQDNLSWRNVEFHIDTWREHSEYSANNKLYSDPQEWEDEKEANILCRKIEEVFRWGNGSRHIPLSALRQINSIIAEHEPKPEVVTSPTTTPELK